MSNNYFPYSEKEAKAVGVKNRFAYNEKTEFPNRLKELREKKGETLIVAAQGIGVTRSTLGLYERGDNVPDVKVLTRIAKHYGATVNYLLGEDERPSFSGDYISKQLGLTDSSIQRLMNLKETAQSKQGVDDGAQFSLDLINFILEYDGFDAIKTVARVLARMILLNSRIGVQFVPTGTPDEIAQLDCAAAIKGFVLIDNASAVEFFKEKLGRLVAFAIEAGLQHQIDDGTDIAQILGVEKWQV